MTYQLKLLGRFQMLSPVGDSITISAKKNQALIAILALADGEPVARHRLMRILWGDRGEEQARNSLRQAFTALRKTFAVTGAFPFVVDDDTAAANLAEIRIDARELAKLNGSSDLESCRKITDLWRGELLEGLSISGQDLEEWLLAERQKYEEKYLSELGTLIRRYESAGETEAAITAAQRLLKTDPLQEAAHRCIMKGHAAAGDRTKALKQYQVCKDTLQRELGISPEAATEELHQEIAEDRFAKTAPASSVTQTEPKEEHADASTGAISQKPSIAVLPFENLSGDPEQEYFSDGLTVDIITELSRYSSVVVIGRQSSFACKGSTLDTGQLAEKLGARNLVEGSVRRAGSRVRITAQLLEGKSGISLWSERYDREMADIFALQDEITRTIVSTVWGRVEKANFARVARLSEADLEAYDLVLRGRGLVFAFNKKDNATARDLLQRSLEVDPENPEALSTLALAHFLDWMCFWVSDRKASMERGLESARKSVSLDSVNSRARWQLGELLLFNLKHEEARVQLETAIELNPNDIEVRTMYGFFLSTIGEPDAAIAEFEKIRNRNPLDLSGYYWLRGIAFFEARQYEEAIASLKQIPIQITEAYFWLAAAYGQVERPTEARAALEEFLRLAQDEMECFPGLQLEDWEEYCYAISAFKYRESLLHLLEGLRKAGFDEVAASLASDAKPSIAVLPFTNISGNPDQEYFADGLTEDIITELARFRDLAVTASNTSFTYKGRAVNVKDVSRQLDVRYVIEGSVQRAKEKIRISVQLIDGESGNHLWSERYDRQLGDIFAVQDEVTRTIVATLASGWSGRLRKAWQGRSGRSNTRNPQAFDSFMRGMDLFTFDKEETRRAASHYEEAIRLDPNYAKAYSKLAWVHIIDAAYGWSEDYDASMAKGLEAAKKGVEQDDDESWAHWALAGYYWFASRHDLAFAAFDKALSLNSNDAEILMDYGLCLSYAGRAEEGLALAERGMRINPHFPEWFLIELGQIYFDARQYEKAVDTFDSLRKIETTLVHLYLAASHAALGNADAARASIARVLALDPKATLQRWTSKELAPYKYPEDVEHLRVNLEKAGLPE